MKWKALVFYGEGACEVSWDFIVLALAGAGERSSPDERVSARPDLGKGRGGEWRSFRGTVKFCKNAIVSGNGEVETGRLCSGKRLSFMTKARVKSRGISLF